MKIMVQGDRDAAGIAELAAAIAAIVAKMKVVVNLGAYGELVKIFLDAGCKAFCHTHRGKGKIAPNVSYYDCELLSKTLGFADQEAAWGIRLGLMLRADAFLFFSGREGTLAHLFPALAFAKKKGRRVALVGWPKDQEAAILALLGGEQVWLRLFDANDDPQLVVDFLLGA
jgi:hypothetical protein